MILPSYRIGSVTSPRLANCEPLVEVVEHFRQVILGQAVPRSDGHAGRRVLRTIERAQSALDLSLRQVQAAMPRPVRLVQGARA